MLSSVCICNYGNHLLCLPFFLIFFSHFIIIILELPLELHSEQQILTRFSHVSIVGRLCDASVMSALKLYLQFLRCKCKEMQMNGMWPVNFNLKNISWYDSYAYHVQYVIFNLPLLHLLYLPVVLLSLKNVFTIFRIHRSKREVQLSSCCLCIQPVTM